MVEVLLLVVALVVVVVAKQLAEAKGLSLSLLLYYPLRQ
jgi:hypothetical protein